MRRLTYKDEFGRWTADVHYGGAVEHLRDVPIDRLAAFEDIGLMPEEIKANLEMFVAYRHVCGGHSPEEIAALVKAQEAGPCGQCRHNPPSSGDGKPCTMCPAEGCIHAEADEHIVFADGQCPRCGAMTHNYGGPTMRCPDCGWTEQEAGEGHGG